MTKNINQNIIELQRLQKFLASYGFASRRKIEEIISQGRIKVDGQIATLGTKVNHSSKIFIDNQNYLDLLDDEAVESKSRLIVYHKPIGKICTNNDPENRETVFSDLPEISNARWISIGRLDINTSGLLLFTTDGQLANKLMHPSNNYEREYLVRVLGNVDQHKIKLLLSGIELGDGLAKFKSFTVQKAGQKTGVGNGQENTGANTWYKVVLTEGRNRVVRRLFEAVDCTVSRLIRVRFGDYKLPRDLKPGCFRELK
jgi:23S rRNA pseudouridine2605 synthase